MPCLYIAKPIIKDYKAIENIEKYQKIAERKLFLTTLKGILCEALQVKARSIYQIAYVYHSLYFINDKLSKIKLANKKHALAFISK